MLACIDWDRTVGVLRGLARGVRERREGKPDRRLVVNMDGEKSMILLVSICPSVGDIGSLVLRH